MNFQKIQQKGLLKKIKKSVPSIFIKHTNGTIENLSNKVDDSAEISWRYT